MKSTARRTAINLCIQPITLEEANKFITRHHRHHPPLTIWKYGIAVNDGEQVVGVAIVNRPCARHLDDGWTLEVRRLCTDGTRNVASMLYAACWRAAKAMGYRRLITYILASEPGISLRAAGWKVLYQTKGGSWNTPSRPRVDKHPTEPKMLWEINNFEREQP